MDPAKAARIEARYKARRARQADPLPDPKAVDAAIRSAAKHHGWATDDFTPAENAKFTLWGLTVLALPFILIALFLYALLG